MAERMQFLRAAMIGAVALPGSVLTGSVLTGSVLAGAAMAGTPPASPVIDDFTTGSFYRPTPAAVATTVITAPGAWGGSRAITTYGNIGTSPSYGQTSSVSNGLNAAHAVVPPALVLSAGYQVFPRVESAYGTKKAFSFNLSAYDRLRVTFGNLEYSLNFNAQMQSGGPAGNLIIWGCNFAPTALGYGLTADMPFSDYPGFDFKNVSAVYLILQASTNWSVQKVEVVGPSTPPAALTCHPPVVAR